MILPLVAEWDVLLESVESKKFKFDENLKSKWIKMDKYKTHMVLTEILRDRGYDVEGDDQLSFAEFSKKFPILPENLVYFNKDPILISYVQVLNKGTTGTGSISKVINYMKQNKFSHALLVLTEKLSSKAAEDVENVKNDLEIELFLEKELRFNPTKHRLVPRHEKLDPKDAALVMKKMKTDEEKMPRLERLDIISRIYNYHIGDVIAIHRKEGMYYRIVV